jgi:hypothetical protein
MFSRSCFRLCCSWLSRLRRAPLGTPGSSSQRWTGPGPQACGCAQERIKTVLRCAPCLSKTSVVSLQAPPLQSSLAPFRRRPQASVRNASLNGSGHVGRVSRQRANLLVLCRTCAAPTLTVPKLCRGGPGKRCGKRRKWLIYNNLPRRHRSHNPLVVGSSPTRPTSSIGVFAIETAHQRQLDGCWCQFWSDGCWLSADCQTHGFVDPAECFYRPVVAS